MYIEFYTFVYKMYELQKKNQLSKNWTLINISNAKTILEFYKSTKKIFSIKTTRYFLILKIKKQKKNQLASIDRSKFNIYRKKIYQIINYF